MVTFEHDLDVADKNYHDVVHDSEFKEQEHAHCSVLTSDLPDGHLLLDLADDPTHCHNVAPCSVF